MENYPRDLETIFSSQFCVFLYWKTMRKFKEKMESIWRTGKVARKQEA